MAKKSLLGSFLPIQDPREYFLDLARVAETLRMDTGCCEVAGQT